MYMMIWLCRTRSRQPPAKIPLGKTNLHQRRAAARPMPNLLVSGGMILPSWDDVDVAVKFEIVMTVCYILLFDVSRKLTW